MKILHAIFSRTAFVIVTAVVELLLLVSIFLWFREQAVWIESILRVLSLIIVLTIIRWSRHLSSDLMWILLIILFPVAGTAIYILVGADLLGSRTTRNLLKSEQAGMKYLKQDPEVLEELQKEAPDLAGQFRYISESAGYPFSRNTGFDYYGLGDDGYPVMLEEMRKAEKFIFLEYFIIEEGQMWNGMLEILEEKAKQGLDIRVLYDDLGSFSTLSSHYADQLEAKGIKCIPFNRVNPILNIVLNHRDHRKIMVIDGKTAFSGGVNLADEYINAVVKHGHWKDTVIRVKGEAVWTFTVMFLSHWNAFRNEDPDYTVFKAEAQPGEHDGYIAPYGDSPFVPDKIAQDIYVGMLNRANKYCYIETPYLIVDTDMINSLILAAKQGVDVRIITPGVPDKRIVWEITRSYYRQLLEGGVKIYEYTPGFIHAKVFAADDRMASVGTVNLDYRSLYLHFENSTFIYGSKRVIDIRDDFLATLEQCRQIRKESLKPSPVRDFLIGIVRLFAPML